MQEELKKQLRTPYEELKFMMGGTPQPGPESIFIRAVTIEHFQEILGRMNSLTKSEV
jgi:hypothetical protein